MWIGDRGDHYELIATYEDELWIWSGQKVALINEIKEDFQLKNVGPPDYYLGGNVDYLTEHWTRENIKLGFFAKSYIENVVVPLLVVLLPSPPHLLLL